MFAKKGGKVDIELKPNNAASSVNIYGRYVLRRVEPLSSNGRNKEK